MAAGAIVANGLEGFTESIRTKFQYEDDRLRREVKEEEVEHAIKQDIADLATRHLTKKEIDVIRPNKGSELVVTVSRPTRLGSKKKQIAYHAHLLEKDNGFSVELDHKQRGEELLCASITVSRDFPGVVKDKPNSIVMNVESKGELNEIARITVAIPYADASIVKLVICSNGSVDWVNWQDSTNNDELLALIPDLTLKDLKNMHVPETRDRAFTILRSMLFFNKTVAEGE